MKRDATHSQQGFALPMLAAVIIAAVIIILFGLPGIKSSSDSELESVNRQYVDRWFDAMYAHYRSGGVSSGALPCPDDIANNSGTGAGGQGPAGDCVPVSGRVRVSADGLFVMGDLPMLPGMPIDSFRAPNKPVKALYIMQRDATDPRKVQNREFQKLAVLKRNGKTIGVGIGFIIIPGKDNCGFYSENFSITSTGDYVRDGKCRADDMAILGLAANGQAVGDFTGSIDVTDETTVQVYLIPSPADYLGLGALTPAPVTLCGNGVLNSGEQCDDTNTLDGDGCSSVCQIEGGGPVCGNGILEIGEQCDDGATIDGDGCSAACQNEVTGSSASGSSSGPGSSGSSGSTSSSTSSGSSASSSSSASSGSSSSGSDSSNSSSSGGSDSSNSSSGSDSSNGSSSGADASSGTSSGSSRESGCKNIIHSDESCPGTFAQVAGASGTNLCNVPAAEGAPSCSGPGGGSVFAYKCSAYGFLSGASFAFYSYPVDCSNPDVQTVAGYCTRDCANHGSVDAVDMMLVKECESGPPCVYVCMCQQVGPPCGDLNEPCCGGTTCLIGGGSCVSGGASGGGNICGGTCTPAGPGSCCTSPGGVTCCTSPDGSTTSCST